MIIIFVGNVLNSEIKDAERPMEQRVNVTEFVLLGLTQSPQGQKILFVIFLLIYLVTMVGNLLIVLTVVSSPTLDVPMYFFLGNLSFMDAVYSTTVTPSMIIDLFYVKKTISFQACMIQLFTEHLFGGAEILLLVSWPMTATWPSANLCII